MKLLAGCIVTAGLVVTILPAKAQTLVYDSPYLAAGGAHRQIVVPDDVDEPYLVEPPGPPPDAALPPAPFPVPSRYPSYGRLSGYEPMLLPRRELDAMIRDAGFWPLGAPRRRGVTYELAASDPDGLDGMLVIDGRTGRIVRFVPAVVPGRPITAVPARLSGARAALAPPIDPVPRPPAAIPHVAPRDVAVRPAPVPTPKTAETAASHAQMPASSAAQAQPPSTSEVRPLPAIKPTEAMPPVQDLQ